MFLTVKKVPTTSWSSSNPQSFKLKLQTIFYLIFGLVLFGTGEGLLIVSTTGAAPWTVLAQGISINIDKSVGFVTFFISVTVFFFWIFLKLKPGIGTLLNIIIVAVMLDVSIMFFQTPILFYNKFLLAIFGVFLVGLGSGFYLMANLGPGPRDGLMTGLQEKTNLPIVLVRAFLEISVVSIGWYLGGTVGMGTLLFAFGIDHRLYSVFI